MNNIFVPDMRKTIFLAGYFFGLGAAMLAGFACWQVLPLFGTFILLVAATGLAVFAKWRGFPAWATFFVTISLIILCGLGTWQIKRLHWKEALLAQMDAAYADKNPPLLTYPDILDAAKAGDDFKAVQLQGAFAVRKQMLLGVRTWQGQPGYHVVAVLEMPGGGLVLVNRGWIAMAAGGKTIPPRPPLGPITVTGILHRPERDNIFVPQNDLKTDTLYRWDLPQMAQIMGVQTLAPLVLYETGESIGTGAAAGTDFPVREALRWELPNSHLYYACFWFTMAGVLAVMFWLRFLRRTASSKI